MAFTHVSLLSSDSTEMFFSMSNSRLSAHAPNQTGPLSCLRPLVSHHLFFMESSLFTCPSFTVSSFSDYKRVHHSLSKNCSHSFTLSDGPSALAVLTDCSESLHLLSPATLRSREAVWALTPVLKLLRSSLQ